MDGKKTREQLRAFNDGLREYGCGQRTIPKDWSEAFARLRELLRSGAAVRELGTGRLVVFLDELPWMDTARSDFRTALDHFWNTWGSAQPDLLLIVCGSATSWMISNLIDGHGGFNNRVTRQISLAPFTRAELERREAIGGGQPLTKALRELEQCGFLRKHRDFTKAKNGEVYQLVDPFSLFHLCFIEPNEFDSWISFQGMAAPYRMARPCVRARMPAACRSDEACARHLRHADERVRLAKHKKQSSCPDRSAHRPARRRDQRVRDEVR